MTRGAWRAIGYLALFTGIVVMASTASILVTVAYMTGR